MSEHMERLKKRDQIVDDCVSEVVGIIIDQSDGSLEESLYLKIKVGMKLLEQGFSSMVGNNDRAKDLGKES